MDSHCIPFSEIPHTTKLFVDTLYDFPRVADFYPHDPFDPAGLRAVAREISMEEARRRALGDALAEQNRRFGGDERVEENIGRLARGGAVAVVTGQQVGLFGGPAYSVYKALSAVRLADRLTADGLSAVPVFWLASEDHDFAEINHSSLLDGDYRWQQVRYESSPPDGTPVGTVALDGSIEALRRRVASLWPEGTADEAERFLEGYAPGTTCALAFARLFQRLFAGRGLIVLDPLHARLQELSRPLLRRALESTEDLTRRVRERSKQLDQSGYHAQVKLRENATLFFVLAAGRRLPLRRRRDGFLLAGDGERSLRDLLSELETHPERFSPNVLLRPLMQDWLLPTVAYVAGPNETAYFAQASVLYRELLGRMPVVVPRASLTLVEPKVRRLVEKYKLSLPELFAGAQQVRARLAEGHLPRGLARRLERTEQQLAKLLTETARQVEKLDPTLAGAAETSRRKMLYQYDKIRRKTARAQAERTQVVDRHSEILLNALYPGRGLQERKMNFLSVVARQGPDLVGRLLEQVCFPCRDHQVIPL